MIQPLGRLRSVARRLLGPAGPVIAHREACAWDQLRAVYEEQAARGVPQAVEGLMRMDAGRWPSDGRLRRRRSEAGQERDVAR